MQANEGQQRPNKGQRGPTQAQRRPKWRFTTIVWAVSFSISFFIITTNFFIWFLDYPDQHHSQTTNGQQNRTTDSAAKMRSSGTRDAYASQVLGPKRRYTVVWAPSIFLLYIYICTTVFFCILYKVLNVIDIRYKRYIELFNDACIMLQICWLRMG